MQHDVEQCITEISEIKAQLVAARGEISSTRHEIAELRCEIAGLLEAWRTANGVVKFVKWAAALVAALTTIGVSVSVAKDMALHDIIEAIKK